MLLAYHKARLRAWGLSPVPIVRICRELGGLEFHVNRKTMSRVRGLVLRACLKAMSRARYLVLRACRKAMSQAQRFEASCLL